MATELNVVAAEVLTAAVLRDAYGVAACILAGPDAHPVILPLHIVGAR